MDPFTIAQLASGLVGAGVNFFGQKNQMDDQRRRTQTDLASERRKSAAARQTLQDTNYDVSQSLREFRDKAMQDPVTISSILLPKPITSHRYAHLVISSFL